MDPRPEKLPEHLAKIIQLAIEKLAPTRIWIFGSRARGDARATSDFDLAFEFSNGKEQEWTQLYLSILEDPPSLHKYDLIDFNRANKKLQDIIQQEGILIYGKQEESSGHDSKL